ncbi:MAG: hypothetical protein SGCHY_003637 [Lobulomycetales sp.]
MLQPAAPEEVPLPVLELIWAEELDALIEPAVRYLMAQATLRFPRHLLRLFNRFDEVFACLQIAVQSSFLSQWDASFSEHFYGIKRFQDRPKRPSLRAKSLVQLVLIPYIHSKLSLRFDSARALNWGQKLYSASSLFFKIVYMLRFSRFPSPIHALLGVRMGYQTQAVQATPHKDFSLLASLQQFWMNPQRSLAAFTNAGSLKTLLPLALLAYKFSRWFMETQYEKIKSEMPIPPPPEISGKHPESLLDGDIKVGHCPLCARAFVNPTALVTGYIFCYG